MALGKWEKAAITIPKFPADDLVGIIDKVKDYLNTLATAIDLILSIVPTISDPLSAALKELVDRLRENVESLLDDLGIYIIYVPIRKRFESNFLLWGDSLGDMTPPVADKMGLFGQPQSAVNPDDPGINKFIVNANRVNGGNSGFYKTVIESLYDKGDLSRPQFTSADDYIAGLTLVMGTNVDMFGFLDDIQRLREMFHFSSESGTVPNVPRPQNLKGRVLAKPVKGKVDVFLEWDPIEVPLIKLTDLGGLTLYPKKIAIFRIHDDVKALRVRSVEDLMGTTRLNAGDVFGDAKVISLENYSTFLDVSYIDKGVEVRPDETLYYGVAWRLDALTGGDSLPDFTGNEKVPPSEVENPTAYWQLSNIARIVPEPELPDATPPNWRRTPSLADVFPPLARFLRLVVAEIEKISNKLAGSLDVLSDYANFLREEVNRYEAIVDNILSLIQKMSAQFIMPTAGVYSRLWAGKGGNTYFMTDLANSLNDTYPGAPPFHDGDEYVTGVIMLAGGPYPDVVKFQESISLLFGEMHEDLQDIMERLETQVEQMEDIQFLEDMEPGPPKVVFEENFSDIKRCVAEPPGEVVFNDKMEVERIIP